MDVKQLFNMLKKAQEPKGYYFNNDMDMTMPLLESLLINKERFGYMACPCRLANGDFDADKDIICPCTYREDDVKKYGACFCALYVSKDFNEGKIEKTVVPESRPPEKILF
ncbi:MULTISPECIES: ferredoxin-thioredoxin reductase catalytic domain-containing protein [unclassified Pseudodesulfovibrio]|uniref:ferredoxin-thioredoxin reductase catalytic domain-containing protein n=1 Tax=unclassified Pseudodesulfovibrio TaxID=2661612 RepID=UPI000FEBA788|nr:MULTISPECIES: ferredoxin-thioredoxin reductase catalytic domain-containing protein [unclassified Pseudodesulfovibrio]MCJ2163731.1 ferredoxin:thioredoxin reductase [Pseudodesulfovibrio sp. S3-i]RWU06014.1 ferredoxin:thioredoxin reductase [Pseudodesulfovibrio sp. S3]